MKIHIIRASGTEEHVEASFADIQRLISAPCLDTVNLRDGRVMVLDDTGHIRGLAVNVPATKLYHGVCRPGTTWKIRGDVAIVVDREVEAEEAEARG